MDLRRPPARDDSASQSPRPAKSRKVEPVNPPQLSGLDCLLQSAKPEEANYIRVDLDDTEIHCGEICIEQADVSAELQTFVVFSPTVVLQEEITDADGFGLKTDEPGYIAIDFLDNLLGTNGAKQDSSTLVVDIGIGATRSRSRCYTKLRALRRQEGETLAFNFTHGHLPQVCVEMHGKMEPILFTPKENPRKWSVVVFCTGFSQDVLMDATSSPLGSLRVQARMQPRRNLLTETLAWRLSLDDAFMDAAFVIEDENRVRTHFPMHAAVAAAHSDVLKRAFDARGFQNSREWLLEKTSPATAKTAHVVSILRDYLYGMCPISVDMVPGLVPHAVMLQIPTLVDEIHRLVLEDLDDENLVEILKSLSPYQHTREFGAVWVTLRKQVVKSRTLATICFDLLFLGS